MRLIERDWEYLAAEIAYFANYNQIDISEQRAYTEGFENAKVLEIGGCYTGDNIYLAVKADELLLVSCGCWD